MVKNHYTYAIIQAISEMQIHYQDLEAHFLSFNRVVPYSNNSDNVYSPRLYNILQAACPQIISMLHHITQLVGLHSSRKQRSFPFYFKLLNSNNQSTCCRCRRFLQKKT